MERPREWERTGEGAERQEESEQKFDTTYRTLHVHFSLNCKVCRSMWKILSGTSILEELNHGTPLSFVHW